MTLIHRATSVAMLKYEIKETASLPHETEAKMEVLNGINLTKTCMRIEMKSSIFSSPAV